MPLNPLAHGPAIGYAMWQLSRGEAFRDVWNKLAAHKSGRNLSDQERYEAVTQAQINLRQTGKIKIARPDTPVSAGFEGTLLRVDKVGVRVKLWLSYPDGRVEEVSVTLNVDRMTTKSQVLEMARQFYRSGAYRTRWQAGYEGEIMTDQFGREQTDDGRSTVEIVALIAGGLPSPAVGPPMVE